MPRKTKWGPGEPLEGYFFPFLHGSKGARHSSLGEGAPYGARVSRAAPSPLSEAPSLFLTTQISKNQILVHWNTS